MRETGPLTIIRNCRVCNGKLGEDVLNLNAQALTGIFVENGKDVATCEISLSMCENKSCGLVQINQVYDLDLLYGDHYGYASGLNSSMVAHLKLKADLLQAKIDLKDGDIVIDIGSNDATSLSFYPKTSHRIGVDATGSKFSDNYKKIGAQLMPEFFPSKMLDKHLAGKKAKIISSYSCFYDLPDPVYFAKGIAESLDQEGIWCLEQSYLPAMLETNSFDTVCHEHVEYYRLIDIKNICDAADLKILDVNFNDINGGSFTLDVAHKTSGLTVSPRVQEIIEKEEATDWTEEFRAFRERINSCREELLSTLKDLKEQGKRVVGIGASTKGNVLLQYYNITPDLMDVIGEVNSDKFGCQTPGTGIPIVSEDELLKEDPDYLLVLPWHFREFLLDSPKFKGRKLLFPLPKVEIVET
jgi:hypothetical protein